MREQRTKGVVPVVTIVASLVTIFSFVWQYNIADKPDFRVAVLSSISLLDLTQDEAQDIEVLVAGQAVTNLTKMQILVSNTGNVPFETSHFAEPLVFIVPPDANLISAKVESKRPVTLHAVLLEDTEQGTVMWEPELFNPQDQIILSIYFSARSDRLPEVSARIRGVASVELEDARASTDGKGVGKAWSALFRALGWGLSVSIILFSLAGFTVAKVERELRFSLPTLEHEIRVLSDIPSLKDYISQSRLLNKAGRTFVKSLIGAIPQEMVIHEAQERVLFLIGRKAEGNSLVLALVFLSLGLLGISVLVRM